MCWGEKGWLRGCADETFMMSCAAGVWSCRTTRTRMRALGKVSIIQGPERGDTLAEQSTRRLCRALTARHSGNKRASDGHEGVRCCTIMLNYYF